MNNVASLSSAAAHVWSWRCGCERLEREYKVQKRLLLQPDRYTVVLESKIAFYVPSIFSVPILMLFVLVIYLCICVVIDCAVDGCRKANSALTICDGNIKGPNERFC